MYIYERAHPNRISLSWSKRSQRLFADDLSAVRALTGIIKSHIKQELSHLLMLSKINWRRCYFGHGQLIAL